MSSRISNFMKGSKQKQKQKALPELPSPPGLIEDAKFDYVQLGDSELLVTNVCLGTMTWGQQNSEEEAHEQLDYAIKERGVNFIDTAEIYAVPSGGRKTLNKTEQIIGNWIAKNKEWREKIVIASKVAGYIKSSHTPQGRLKENGYLATNSPADAPKGETRLTPDQLWEACNASLARLQTDYLDLYQLHWPDRYKPSFGSQMYDYSLRREDELPFATIVEGVKQLLDAGKIRTWGVSNESTFGITMLCVECERQGIPKPVSIQNSHSLLHRQYETSTVEACAPWNFNVSLLPWSPLAGGALSGKYRNGELPAGARFTEFKNYQGRFCSAATNDAIEKYAQVAEELGISLAKLSLVWLKTRPYMMNGSTIIGATTMEQLKENLDAFDNEENYTLSKEVLRKLDGIYNKNKDPPQTVLDYFD